LDRATIQSRVIEIFSRPMSARTTEDYSFLEEAAFNERALARLGRKVRSMTGYSIDRSLEVVHDVAANLIERGFDTYDPQRADFQRWIDAAIHNAVRDGWRALKTEQTALAKLVGLEHIALIGGSLSTASPEQIAISRQYRGLFLQLLKTLSGAERRAIWGRYRERSYAEIAARSGISVLNARQLVARGREKMRQAAKGAGVEIGLRGRT
jgi:RNA polymerase sigma factor (sigma-70 family)